MNSIKKVKNYISNKLKSVQSTIFNQKRILKKLWKNRKYFIPYIKNNKEKISFYSFETYIIRQQPKVKFMLNFMARLDRIKI